MLVIIESKNANCTLLFIRSAAAARPSPFGAVRTRAVARLAGRLSAEHPAAASEAPALQNARCAGLIRRRCGVGHLRFRDD